MATDGKTIKLDRCTICRCLTNAVVPVLVDVPDVGKKPRAVNGIELCRGCLKAVRDRGKPGDGHGPLSAYPSRRLNVPSAARSTVSGGHVRSEFDAYLRGIAEQLKVEPHRVECDVRVGNGGALLLDVLVDGQDLTGPEERIVAAYLSEAFPGVKTRAER